MFLSLSTSRFVIAFWRYSVVKILASSITFSSGNATCETLYRFNMLLTSLRE
eukprot:Gb_05027 [translate_table: standard]